MSDSNKPITRAEGLAIISRGDTAQAETQEQREALNLEAQHASKK